MAKRLAMWRGRGPLRPAELAEAAVLADVSVALIALGWLLPVTTLFIAAAMAPMAAIAARNRPRAVLAGAVAGTTVAMLIAGTGLASNVVACAVLGTLLGVAWRRRWGMIRMVLVAVALFWPPAAIGADLVLSAFSQLRTLALDQITNTWGGAKSNLRFIGLVRLTRWLDPVVRWVVAHWAIGVPAALLVGIVGGSIMGRLLSWPPLARLERTRLAPPTPEAAATRGATSDPAQAATPPTSDPGARAPPPTPPRAPPPTPARPPPLAVPPPPPPSRASRDRCLCGSSTSATPTRRWRRPPSRGCH